MSHPQAPPPAGDVATTPPAHRSPLPPVNLALLGALAAVAPLVTDLYLPGLPQLATDLGVGAAVSQLSLSACLLGLALGQLVAGPLSDRVGRLGPLRWGVGLLALTSFLCALAPSSAVLLVLRLLQGLAGAAALVISRAIVRDVYDGARAAKVFSELMLVMGLAPILGPVIGGQLLRVTDWRGIFVFLGVLCSVLLVAVVVRLEETRAPSSTGAAGLPHPVRELAGLLGDRRFLGFLALASLLGIVLFSYISMSAFVLQDHYDISPAAYSLVFGTNAVGLVVGSQVSSRLVMRVGPELMLRGALWLTVLATALLAVTLGLGAPLPVPLVPLWFVLVGLGGSMGNVVALALLPHGARAGSAAALLGTCQFLFGAAVPPLVSLGGATGPVMGVTMAVAATLALTTYVALCAARSPLESTLR